MILLEHSNVIIREALLRFLNADKKPSPLDVTCADFDSVVFRMWTESDLKTLNVAIKGPSVFPLLEADGMEVLKAAYGAGVVAPQDNWDAQLCFNTSGIPPSDRESFADRISKFKTHLYASPIASRIQAANEGRVNSTLCDVPLYSQEQRLWVRQEDTKKITAIFSVRFEDPDDVVMARVFLNEFQKPIGGAPTCSYSIKTLPLELNGIRSLKRTDDLFFVSFVLYSHHYAGDKAESAAFLMSTFRNYLHYHIKCCKSYLHTRMRRTVDSLLKVLNRARQEAKKEPKTSQRKFLKLNTSK